MPPWPKAYEKTKPKDSSMNINSGTAPFEIPIALIAAARQVLDSKEQRVIAF
jgi:hypothetical protein